MCVFRVIVLTHSDESAAFAGLRSGDALVFQDAESLIQSHRRLFPHAVDVKLQGDSFRWYWFLLLLHLDWGRADGCRGVQGPSTGRLRLRHGGSGVVDGNGQDPTAVC